MRSSDFNIRRLEALRERGQLPEQAVPEPTVTPREWPQLDEAAYHGPAGEIARLLEPETEADPVAILAQLLVAFGSVVGRSCWFQVGAVRHYPNLFVALVGDTSKARKGQSQAEARWWLEAVDEEWAQACQGHGLASGEGLIQAVRDPSEAKMKAGKTVETDLGVLDKRLHIVEPEQARTLRVAARDGNTLSAVIRTAWDTGNLRVMTRTAPLRATGAHVSVVGHITVEELVRSLSEIDVANGFANRFIWLLVKRSKLLPFGGDPAAFDRGPLLQRLRAAVDFAYEHAEEVVFDAGARELWEAAYPELTKARAGLVGSIVARAEAQVVRLALVHALLDRSPQVSRAHLLAAGALVDYAEASARYIWGDSLGDPMADTIFQALRSVRPRGLTRSDLRNLFNRNRRSADITRALGRLLELDLAVCERVDTKGRPREVWKVRP